MVKFIKCECGKRYKEGNYKHFETKEHKKFIQDKEIKKSNETHIIVYDIDKVQLMEYLKSKTINKKKFIINDDDINDLDYQPNKSDTDDTDKSSGSGSDSGDVFEAD